ncbi:hypothetical protein BS50DRAFT_32845 [Corynespora cassiicola Philippines]|uniref:Uncharacterized protein n=1 Tax=Corynespora cassiicola Philippines TaxID=1448308 RepID=A0A2T2PBU5_CORCC|nr:hypothetical protein BS50DRAFT_32845 [Corynespora cassiicola Philippines]
MSGRTGPKAKQPIKYGEIGSSRLRYEIQPDLMVDEHFAGKSNIEVPGSDIIIPETQPDNGEEEMQNRLLEEEPLSPNSRSLIEKNAATKESSSLAPPEPYKFLSKQSTTDSGLLTPSFSFAPMASKNTHASSKNSKLSPRPSIASSTLLSDRAALEVDRARSEEGLTGSATYVRDFPGHQADTMRGRYEPKYNAPKPQNEQDIGFGPKGTEEGTASDTNGFGFSRSRENTVSFGPVEPPAAIVQKTSAKAKKSRKIPKAQISMDPWPPRARGTSVQPIPAIPANESYTVKCSGNIRAQLIEDPKTTSNHLEVEKQRSNPPHTENDNLRIPENATHGPLENPSAIGAEKNRADTEREAHRLPTHIDSTTQFEESKENEASVTLPMTADREGNGSPSGNGGRQSPMSIAHETSWVGVSGRVSKPQLRQCNSVQPGVKQIQVKRSPMPSLSFDQYLDGIRMMHNAEQTRVRQNHDTRIKDLEDIIGLLR